MPGQTYAETQHLNRAIQPESTFLHPYMRSFVNFEATKPPPPPPPAFKTFVPPMVGTSVPESGKRGDVEKPLENLSRGMAEYNYNRTCAIMRGSKAGC